MHFQKLLKECRSRSLDISTPRKSYLLASLVNQVRSQSEGRTPLPGKAVTAKLNKQTEELLQLSPSALREQCLREGLETTGSKQQLVNRLSVWSSTAVPSAPLSSTGGAPSEPFSTPRRRIREKSPWPSPGDTPRKRIRSKSADPMLLTPRWRVNAKSPASAYTTAPLRQRVGDSLASQVLSQSRAAHSAVVSPLPPSRRRSRTEEPGHSSHNSSHSPAVKALMVLRADQLRKECERRGISTARSKQDMALKLVEASREDSIIGSPASSTSTVLLTKSPMQETPTQVRGTPRISAEAAPAAMPSSLLKRPYSRSRTPAPAASAALPQVPAMSAGNLPIPPAPAPTAPLTATAAPTTPKRPTTRSRTRSPLSGSQFQQPPAQAVTASVASLLCRPPGASTRGITATTPSTPDRRSRSRAALFSERPDQKAAVVTSGEKPFRGRSLDAPIGTDEKRAATPASGRRAFSRSPSLGRNKLAGTCNGKTKEGLGCQNVGSTRPMGAIFFYCSRHSSDWPRFER